MSALHMWKERPPKKRTNCDDVSDWVTGCVSEMAYHRCPLDGLPQAEEECPLAETVTKHSVCDRRENVKDDSHTDEDLPRGDVELVDFIRKPAHDEVVCKRKRDGRSDSVVGEDVSDDSDLAGDLDVAPQELAEERRDRASSEPVAERMEDELVATVGVLLPASKLIVDSKRHTFFEATVVVGSEADDKAVHLQT